ncbi:MAG: acyl-CoA dehydrogenase family protein [Candidatus Riflebacteria bacterium]|nr:acyl-CoA dehydrogenase family protein [Candidatus Riflebacteria bacterium]
MEFSLTSDQEMIIKTARDFAQKKLKPVAAHCDETGNINKGNLKELGRLGFFSMVVPEEEGGAGMDYVTYAHCMIEFSKACASTAVILSVHNSLCLDIMRHFANDTHKKKYLDDMLTGKKIAAFSLTEPNAGSDATEISLNAKLDGDHYILNGTKCFVTNGDLADIYFVFGTVNKELGSKGTVCFLVEKGTPGFSIGKHEKKMGLKASPTTELIFENAKVPVANLIGEEGRGIKIALSILEGGRIGIAAQAIGIAEAAYEAAKSYSKERVQFKKPLCANQAIAFKLADMLTRIEAAKYLTYRAAWVKDQGKKPTLEASMAKLFASETAQFVTYEAVQIHGGYGYIVEYPVERYFRDARVTTIYEGTSEIQRIVISNNLLKN